ncbi:hypothetical protein Pcinc_036392 [Petrolisthes cinctipes]|uniref:DNA ligase n=1 Tax=Petrolisthes cinctipes TaxID=88211 RepID=A0AAE1EML5_PETCI|nr:hypothetical protein Pcinc_036392 [Petrolisthes cinctipes]
MVQRSILSFFSAPKAKKAEGSTSSDVSHNKNKEKQAASEPEDSPVKKHAGSRHRKSRVIDSDSEDDTQEQQPSTSSSPSKSDEEKENKVKESPVKGKDSKQDLEETDEPALPKDDNRTAKKKRETNASPVIKKSSKNLNLENGKANTQHEKKSQEEEMETEDTEAPERQISDNESDDDENQVVQRKREVENNDCLDKGIDNPCTPNTATASSSQKSPGFTPSTVPPLRKTARKQLKRKSDSMEDKQKKLIKKLKGENGSPKKSTKKEEDSIKQSPEIKNKEETNEDKCSVNEEPMEVEEREEEKQFEKEEKSTSGRPKPTAMHSFFAAKGPVKKSASPVKCAEDKGTSSSPVKAKDSSESPEPKVSLKEETLEEENCSSPMKKVKPDKKENSKNKKGDVSSKSKKKASPKTKKNPSPNSKKEISHNEEQSKVATSLEKEKNETEASPEKEKNEKEKSTETVESTEKKPKVNPFAPKPSLCSKDVGADYNPGKKKYHPIDDAFWKKSERVPYLALARTMELIENTSGRLRTIEILANFYRSVIVLSPDDLLYCVYLCLNKVAPAFEGVELRVGETILMRSIAQSSGRSVEMIKSDVEKQGDLGIIAEQSRSSQRLMFQPAKLNVKAVFDKLKEIAFMTGNASQSRKIDKIKVMYVACRFSEARYMIRSLEGKLRIGLAEQSVLQALAQACYLTPPDQNYPPEVIDSGSGVAPDRLKAKLDNSGLILKTTYCEFPSYDKIIPILLEEGLEALPKRCQLTPGVPLKPMLAHPTSGVSEVLKRFENAKFTCEFKYDGERAQIHLKEDGSITIYSRNQEDNTTKYPDIISRFKNAVMDNVKSCVIDSEAVAWDREKKQILPFQILSTRKRKDANEEEIKVQVCVFPFDLLYLNGEPLVKQTFEHRRTLLRENFKEVEGEFVFAKSMDSTNTEDIEEFLEESIKGNCEGLMVKTLDVDATYEIAKRSRNWLKLKKDYLDGVGDTIDVVALGGYMGKGKRAGQYGGFLLSCYDPDNEEYQSLCKIGTGFSEESLQKHTEFFKDHIIEKPKSYYRYENSIAPDHWFEPVQVWEIKCADLSISPVHKAAAGIVDPERGISLRFPRFLRIREDKTPEDATSSSQIADLYNSQDQIKNKKLGKTDEEDFY